MYNDKIMELFKNPKNMGKIDDPDGTVMMRNLICGDQIEFFMKVDNEIITEIRFRTFGCAAAIAASSIITEIVANKTLEQVRNITKNDLITELGGLPPIKMYCIDSVIEAFFLMIEEYTKKKKDSKSSAS